MFYHTPVIFRMLFLIAGNETNNSKKLLRKLNCSESAKLLRTDGSARAPNPTALNPAGLKIATEIRARTDAEIGRISSFFSFFLEGESARGDGHESSPSSGIKTKGENSSGFRQPCTQQYKYMQTVKKKQNKTHINHAQEARKHAGCISCRPVQYIEKKIWFIWKFKTLKAPSRTVYITAECVQNYGSVGFLEEKSSNKFLCGFYWGLIAYKMYILDHAVAPWFLEVTLNLKRSFYFLLPQNLPWHPPAPPAAKSSNLIHT